MASHNRRILVGKRGEQAAEKYLIALGYSIIERNWRCRSGEIDLIAKSADALVIVEVRTRSTKGAFGLPLESVIPRKQTQVKKVAAIYLQHNHVIHQSIRFDVVAVQFNPDLTSCEINHIEAAF